MSNSDNAMLLKPSESENGSVKSKKRFSRIREQNVGDGATNVAQHLTSSLDDTVSHSKPTESTQGRTSRSLLGPNSPLMTSPELVQQQKQRASFRQQQQENQQENHQQQHTSMSNALSSVLSESHSNNVNSGQANLPDLDWDGKGLLCAALTSPPSTDTSGQTTHQFDGDNSRKTSRCGFNKAKDTSGATVRCIVPVEGVTVVQTLSCLRCLSLARSFFMSNTKQQALGPDGIIEIVAVVFLCVFDVAESVVNGSYLYSPPSTSGEQVSGAFVMYILIWPFLVPVDPFFTFFVVVFWKNRDARYASVLTFYSCINVLASMAVFLISLYMNDRSKVLASIFVLDGTWPYFVLLPLLNIILKIIRVWLTQRCIARFEGGTHRTDKVGWSSILYCSVTDNTKIWY
jgi:hypothetical protein